MNQLPEEVRPIADSEGATRRRLALERQLPLHDYDSKACHDLTADEEQCMEKFVAHFKRDAVGQGVVQEQIPMDQRNDKALVAKEETPVWVKQFLLSGRFLKKKLTKYVLFFRIVINAEHQCMVVKLLFLPKEQAPT